MSTVAQKASESRAFLLKESRSGVSGEGRARQAEGGWEDDEGGGRRGWICT